MAPTALRDFFVSAVGDQITSLSCSCLQVLFSSFLARSLTQRTLLRCLAEVICLNHDNEMFALAQAGSSISGGCFPKTLEDFLFYLKKLPEMQKQKTNPIYDFHVIYVCFPSF